ncbi:Spermidine/putrescine import ATP-binding protein PotA [Mesorhizobium ventifaucium]|uniref:Spermidine/putrescine import ATP-binding protein PotA n=2 Tax=Mesorhizobium ventifaucium TaxID=666020 RepID=A0ABN8JFT9_9HYPH|nr:Spermidine/putrescine import ATP-binding protein PotA [Mesorhizobium ventifaucium]
MLEIEGATHRYGELTALDNVSLSARQGEFLTILGESGSGKTTLLRVISGLEQPTEVGKLMIGGENVVGVPPSRRNCTTVFQSYALFPHMSVAENIAYGLVVRGISRDDARKQASKALETVRLPGFEDRRVSQLSGGQKQRVAIARAIVTRPAVLLLDEPLGALDERLRLNMQNELTDLQRQLKTTFVYITHSQEEALAMSDRIVLMRSGRIEQLGTPSELFDLPTSTFAAEFMGFENLLPGVARSVDGNLVSVALSGGSPVVGIAANPAGISQGDLVTIAIRAERLSHSDVSRKQCRHLNTLAGTKIDQRYRGKYSDLDIETAAGKLKVRTWDNASLPEEISSVSWRAEDCIVLPTAANRKT